MESVTRTSSFNSNATVLDRPRILAISLSQAHNFGPEDNTSADLHKVIVENSVLIHAKTKQAVRSELANNKPDSIFIADEGIILPEYATLWQDIVAYVRERPGGIKPVLGCRFASVGMAIGVQLINSLFFVARLPLSCGPRFNNTKYVLNENTDYLNEVKGSRPNFKLPMNPEIREAWQLWGVKGKDTIYLADKNSHDSTPVPASLRVAVSNSKIGNGWLGFVGCVDGGRDSLLIILSLLGIDIPFPK
ncbi:hypothetical protein B0H66DRAFT_591598 [Apodospora peruviana]|uniref:Uncharacterized protein n=1 Tax=Apodospora peruviana TaxID=516989 RepID=A0AAE0I5S5_9PEZI|nr:hypothetical protein B0H66DRAFT_591598 [Apodospora peruviana]